MFNFLNRFKKKINQPKELLKEISSLKSPTNFKTKTFYEEEIDEKRLHFIIDHFEKRIRQAIIAKNTNSEQFGKGRLISPDWIIIQDQAIQPMLGYNNNIVIYCLTKTNSDGDPIWGENMIYFSGKKEMPLKTFLIKKIKTNQDVQNFEMVLIKML
jgi:hypothetical protein